MKRVEHFKFFGVRIPNKLSWFKHTKTVVKRAQQHLFPLRTLKRFGMCPHILQKFYRCTIERILTDSITTWYGNCLASNSKVLQRVVHVAQYITGAKLPAIHNLYTRTDQKIVKDSCFPSHRLFSVLPHGKW